LKRSIEKFNALSLLLLLLLFSRPSKLLIAETKPSNLKQTDASYTTIAETAEWEALQEHVAEIDKTYVLK
jgi:hypothetical protein